MISDRTCHLDWGRPKIWGRRKHQHTVGKYPSVKTLSKLVLPQAPSPIMTSFLHVAMGQQAGPLSRIAGAPASTVARSKVEPWACGKEEFALDSYLRITFDALPLDMLKRCDDVLLDGRLDEQQTGPGADSCAKWSFPQSYGLFAERSVDGRTSFKQRFPGEVLLNCRPFVSSSRQRRCCAASQEKSCCRVKGIRVDQGGGTDWLVARRFCRNTS